MTQVTQLGIFPSNTYRNQNSSLDGKSATCVTCVTPVLALALFVTPFV